MDTINIVLNKNFYNYVKAILLCDGSNASTIVNTSSGINSTIQALQPLYTLSGSTLSQLRTTVYYNSTAYIYGNLSLFSFKNNNSTGGTRFVFGAGDSTPSVNDITMADDPTSQVDANNPSTQIDPSAYGVSLTASHFVNNDKTVNAFNVTITNSSNSAITLGEIALVKNTQTETYSYQDIMLGRGVFDQPVTLNAGESKTYQVKIEM